PRAAPSTSRSATTTRPRAGRRTAARRSRWWTATRSPRRPRRGPELAPGRGPAAFAAVVAAERALHAAAVDAAGEVALHPGLVDEHEVDLRAAQHRVAQPGLHLAELRPALDLLEALLDHEVELLARSAGQLDAPLAVDARGDDPEEGLAARDARGLVGHPVVHGERVRDDARAGPHLQDRGAQLDVERRQQVHGDDRRLAEVGGEDVAVDDRRLARDAGLLRVALRVLRHLGVVLDAVGARAELLRRRDRDLAVAGAEIVDDVVRLDLRHRQHAVDDLAGLADLRVVILGLLRRGGGQYQRTGERERHPDRGCGVHAVLSGGSYGREGANSSTTARPWHDGSAVVRRFGRGMTVRP